MKRLNLLVLLIIFLPCLLLTPAHASEPIKIGLTLGLTGKYAETSDMQMKGFRLWERDINSRGGILGKKVRVIMHDDKSDPKTAASFYEHLILKEKVDLLFGPYSSEITEAVLPVTEKYGYPILASGASADRLWRKDYRHLFGVYTMAGRYTSGFLEMLAREGLNNIAIVYADDAFSKDIADGTKKGQTVLDLESFYSRSSKKARVILTNLQKRQRHLAQRLLSSAAISMRPWICVCRLAGLDGIQRLTMHRWDLHCRNSTTD